MPQVRANGIDIEYESFGREGDPLILLIMGFAAQLIFWPESLCEGLAAKGFRVVRFDNRDIGKSTHLTDRAAPDIAKLWEKVSSGDEPEVPYSLSDMADDAVGLLDALGAETRPYRRRLHGRHDRPIGRDQPSGQDEKPDLDHVHDRPTRLAPGRS